MVKLMTKKIQGFKKLYPFKSHQLNLNGLQYHYLDQGPPNAPAMVMLHGNPTWSFYYRNLIPVLSKTYRVIVPDHIGCGLSDKPQDYAYTLAQHIQNLETLITHLDLKTINLVMHDWGGAIGMGYAINHPEKMDRFIVLNTAAFFVPLLPWRIKVCRIPKLGDFLVRGLNGFCLAALVFATSQHRRFNRNIIAGYLGPYNNWKNRIAIHRFIQDIPMEAGHGTRTTLDRIEAGLGQFCKHPFLIVWGEDDFCFTKRDFLPIWQSKFPQAQVEVIPRAGHYVLEDAAETIIPLIANFLKR